MAKVLSIPNSDYYIYTQPGGVIRLDTGVESGSVVVSGDLIVNGNTTTVNSEDLSVRDNIITVNNGETGAGITLGEAGIRVERGSLTNGFFVWDETVGWTDPISETYITGAWHAKDASGSTVAVRTNSIPTGGGDLYLINSGTGVISVTGTSDYENNVTDDDHIPNRKYVQDYVTSQLSSNINPRIDDGVVTKTYVETIDFETAGVISNVEIGVDETVIANFYLNRVDLYGLRIDGTTIQVIDSNEDLTLSAAGTGTVRVNDIFQINSVPGIDDATTSPGVPLDGVKIYTKNEGTGNTGIYFVNQDSTQDELISKNKALVLSMLF